MKTFTLNRLSNDFYLDHPYNLFPEIEQKKDRPYIVLLIKIENYNFALPLRTNIKHNYCYKFSRTGRETLSATGVDFISVGALTHTVKAMDISMNIQVEK